MKKTTRKATRKAYFLNKDGSKEWFDIPRDMAEKVLDLQKWIREKRALKAKKQA